MEQHKSTDDSEYSHIYYKFQIYNADLITWLLVRYLRNVVLVGVIIINELHWCLLMYTRNNVQVDIVYFKLLLTCKINLKNSGRPCILVFLHTL
jgi:hypothetical protein